MKLCLWYSYIIQQTGNKNTQTHQVEVYILILHKILYLIYKAICTI